MIRDAVSFVAVCTFVAVALFWLEIAGEQAFRDENASALAALASLQTGEGE